MQYFWDMQSYQRSKMAEALAAFVQETSPLDLVNWTKPFIYSVQVREVIERKSYIFKTEQLRAKYHLTNSSASYLYFHDYYNVVPPEQLLDLFTEFLADAESIDLGITFDRRFPIDRPTYRLYD